jgi:CopA family copper-resistance protein
MFLPSPRRLPDSLPRRRFVQGLAAGGALLGLPPALRAAGAPAGVPELAGSEFDLVIAPLAVNFTGRPRIATAINGSIPAPTLRWRQGQEVTIRVTNRLAEPSSIHWHGILLPYRMDGVPGISFVGIAPGETFTYRFRVQQAGTYWYHSHSGMQEQTGMYGAIVIEAADGETIRAGRDHVIQLSDWTDENPMRVLAKLKAQGDNYNFHQPTAADFLRDAAREGLSGALTSREMWNEMRMSPTDLADLSSETLTYLMNGSTPAGNWTGLFRPGERVRLRFINAAGNSFYDVRIPGLALTVVQADGQDVEPVTVDEFRFGPGETLDVLVTPTDEAYTVFAQAMDRSGYARGTLAVRAGLEAPVPAVDPVQQLGMSDMMGDMDGMAGMDHLTMDHSQHGGMAMPAAPRVRHARSEYGPSVDMRVDSPRTNLDDPGVGLRGNGRRVLTYADLKTLGGPLDPRAGEREVELHLTGNMERYTWSFDGLEFGQSTPVHFRHGERLKVTLHNDTMMTHPMHLHGLWSELLDAGGGFGVRKHTIAVQPAQRVSFLVHADAPGRWAWHCHLMFHMDAGMFREVVVA